MKYIIGTRGSRLAVVQAEYVKERLEEAYPGQEFELRVIKTKGDRIQDRPLDQIGGKGLFVTEIEALILAGEVHIGVHSMKDMPAQPSPGLALAKCWKREDPRDVLILREKRSLWELPPGAVIGTGSKRRVRQLIKLCPQLKAVDIRGNVDTRLDKMEKEKLDGIVLAAAGLHRLHMEHRITQYLTPDEMIPAPAQGILALEVKADSYELLELLDRLADEKAQRAAEAERGFLKGIGGDCHMPVGALYEEGENGIGMLRCMFGNEAGTKTAYVSVKGTDPGELAVKAVRQIKSKLAGTVSLVGGGPGDPGLITVKGLAALRQADCIIYDRLVPSALLAEAKPGCELIYAGKADHHHTMKQEEINSLLCEKAFLYERVVRLKGGDPYVFGRGGEEVLALREKGIPFEVIPGVSSCTAGLSYAGIPVTHRGIAGGFRVVTAHDSSDALADIDFHAMASGTETCVFLMGLSKLPEIADRLIEAGMPADMEAAVISKATTGGQRTAEADLSSIAAKAKAAGLVSPALIVVGRVVSLRDKLNFFETSPLFGKKYLVPKIGHEPSRLAAILRSHGALAEEICVGEIVPSLPEIDGGELSEADWLVFTSRHGVEGFFCALFASGLDVRSLGRIKTAVIGEQTAQCLLRYGISADLAPGAFHSEALRDALKAAADPGSVLWYPKAANADNVLAQQLSPHCRVKELNVYENREIPSEIPDSLPAEEFDGVFFTCASSVRRFWPAVKDRMAGCGVYSIGPKTSAALRACGAQNITEAQQATCEALVESALFPSGWGE